MSIGIANEMLALTMPPHKAVDRIRATVENNFDTGIVEFYNVNAIKSRICNNQRNYKEPALHNLGRGT